MTDESHEHGQPAGDDLHEAVGEPPAPGPEHDLDTLEAESGLARDGCGDDILVQALAEGSTQEVAADRAGISTRTVRRRVRDPEFARKVRTARREMTDEAAGRATALLSAAMDAATCFELGSRRRGSAQRRFSCARRTRRRSSTI